MVWALRGVHLGEVVRHLRNAHLAPLAAATVIATLTYVIRLVRWRLLLRDADGGPLPALPLWHAVAIGFMANNLLPFRAGELVRSIAAARLAGARFPSVLSSVAVERIFDGLAVVALLSLSLLASDLPPAWRSAASRCGMPPRSREPWARPRSSAPSSSSPSPWRRSAPSARVLPAGRLTERIISLIEGLRHGLSVLRSPALLAGTIVWSLVLWLTNAFAFYIAFQAFDIPVGFVGALLMQGILIFGITVQLTPGFLGQFEAAIVAALALYRRAERPRVLLRHRVPRDHLPPDHPARRLVARPNARRAERPASCAAAMTDRGGHGVRPMPS